VPINRTECPECGAGLKSAAGFKVGQTIACPKCETYFQVSEPDEDEAPAKTKSLAKTAPLTTKKMAVKPAAVDDEDEKAEKAAKTEKMRSRDDDDDRPKKKRRDDDEDDDRPKKKKKKKKRDDEEEGGFSYSKSWIRLAVLGVLLTVLGVLGYMLYEKNKKEKQQDAPSAQKDDDDPSKPINQDQIRAAREKAQKGRDAARDGKGQPVNVQPPPPAPPPSQEVLKKRLTGTWVSRQGTTTHKIEYNDDGTFVYTKTAGGEDESIEGTWLVRGMMQNALLIDRTYKTTHPDTGQDVEYTQQGVPVEILPAGKSFRLIGHVVPAPPSKSITTRLNFDKQ
jgi:uncharacterized Zn finger protein (UPF0148 family)